MSRTPLRATLVVAAFALALAACASDTSKPLAQYNPSTTVPATTAAPARPALRVEAMDDMFMGPSTVAAGLTAIKLHNSGPAPHQLQLLRLDDGVTADQAIAATRSPDPAALLRLATPAGGANAITSGGEQDVTVDLQPGTYLEVCFVPDPDGVPHLAKGMVSTLTVTGEDAPAPAPATVGKVTLHDFRFDLPDPFQGNGTVAVTNDGPQPHELTILALTGDHTLPDVVTFFGEHQHTGPPPFSVAGGMGALPAGATGYVDLHLSPGHYVAVCQVPDPATGQPHVLLGMAAPFTVV